MTPSRTTRRRAALATRRRAALATTFVALLGALVLVPAPVVSAESSSRLDSDALVLDTVPAAPAAVAAQAETGATVPGPNGARSLAAPAADATTPAGRQALAEEPGRRHAVSGTVSEFRLIGVQLHTTTTEPALVRVHTGAGWGDWQELSLTADDAPDPGSAEAQRAAAATGGATVSEPMWVGRADGYEVSLPADATDASVKLARDTVRRVKVRAGATAGADVLPAAGLPPINSRASWGARPPKEAAGVAPTVRMAVVHHSVTGNDYSQADVPSILRSIQAFHMDGNGWDDIAYNFAVDRFGTIWETRNGGIANAAIGGHAKGFNYETTGVVALGDFSTAAPSTAMVNSIGDIVGWKLYAHGADPLGTNTYVAGEGTKYAAGTVLNLPNIVGHRDVGSTGCPGDLLYPRLGDIRARAAAKYSQLRGTPGFLATPSMATNANGRPELVAVGNDQQLWRATGDGTGGWSGWSTIGGRVAGRPTIVRNADGRLEVFAVAVGGALVHAWQTSPSGSWGPLLSMGGTFSSDVGVGVGRNTDGRLEVFVQSDRNGVQHAWQVAPNSAWSPYFGIDAPAAFPSTSQLQIGTNADGRLEVFAAGDSGELLHSWQGGGPGGWSPFIGLGGDFAGKLAIGTNADGRLELFGVGRDGELTHTWQVAPSSGWSPTIPLGYRTSVAADTTVTTNVDGRLEVFVAAGNGVEVVHAWQVAPSSPWSPVVGMGGRVTGRIAATRNGNGRLSIAAIDPVVPTRAQANTQVAPSSGWESWVTVG